MPFPAQTFERTQALRVKEVIRDVAMALRNTPAVCPRSDINAMMFDAWRSPRCIRGQQRSHA